MNHWLFQKSNIFSYIYIIVGAMMTYWFIDLCFGKLETMIIFVIYYIVMTCLLDEWIVCRLHKIKYNLPRQDLTRVQRLLKDIVSDLMRKGYVLPHRYRIGYINDPNAFDCLCYSNNHIALSRELLDTYSDRQLKALLTTQCIQMHYKIPSINHLVLISNIVVLLGYILYMLVMFIIHKALALIYKPLATISSVFFISQPTIMIYILHKIKSKATLQNDYKCDRVVCQLGMKFELLEALNEMYSYNRSNRKYAHDLNLRIFKVRSF